MIGFDRFIVVDWSGGNDTGPRPRRDAIWIAEAGQQPVYIRNRLLAQDWLQQRIAAGIALGERLCVGFDFPFGYPQGFAHALTGSHDPFAIWRWLAERIKDAPKGNNRFDLAGQVNLELGQGRGPFWGNGLARDVEGLPRTKAGYSNPFPERRACEAMAKGAFSCWQLAGAGAVGSQVLMGLPVLWHLRQRFGGQVAVWPFEPPEQQIGFVEIWPSLRAAAVRAAERPGDIRDAVQVRVTADWLAGLEPDALHAMLSVHAPEEGWILGVQEQP